MQWRALETAKILAKALKFLLIKFVLMNKFIQAM